MNYLVFKGLNYIMVILLRGYLMPLDEATCLLGLRLSVLCHPINTPLQTARRFTLNISVGRPIGLVVHYWVVLGIVVSKIGLTRSPIGVGLAPVGSTSEPVGPHVYGLGPPLPHCIVGGPIGCIGTSPHRRWWLWVPHCSKAIPQCYSPLCTHR